MTLSSKWHRFARPRRAEKGRVATRLRRNRAKCKQARLPPLARVKQQTLNLDEDIVLPAHSEGQADVKVHRIKKKNLLLLKTKNGLKMNLLSICPLEFYIPSCTAN
tara:strand:- start:60 stop:377 length:318 start_codon:yes stop_codon:yes gene_type:complete